MKKLFDRTQKDIEEEQMLLNELKKIEARKKERDRKTQDLQKLISQADQVSEIKKKLIFVPLLNWRIPFSVTTARRSTTDTNEFSQTRQEN